MWTEFEYCYRDAGNFKAFGSVWMAGALDTDQRAIIETKLEGGEFFIAEQVKIPALYGKLYKWSSGHSTRDDHCWHALVGLREHTSIPATTLLSGSTSEFVERFACVRQWQEELSPHF